MDNARDIIFYSDLGKHIPRFIEVIEGLGKDNLLIDIGVDAGHSSRILLHNATKSNNRVIGVDASDKVVDNIKHPNYSFIISDSVTAGKNYDGNKADFIFIDTTHIHEQVMAELYFLWDHLEVGGVMGFHDSDAASYPPNQHFGGNEWAPVEPGILEFFGLKGKVLKNQTNKNISVEHHTGDYGITFITKKTDKDFKADISRNRWEEIFSARDSLVQAEMREMKNHFGGMVVEFDLI